MMLDPIVRGDDRTFRYTSDAPLTGASIRFRLYSSGFSIAKSTAAGSITISGTVASINVGGADWDSYPAAHRPKEAHLIELEIVLAGKTETPILRYPIDVLRDAIV